MPLTGHAKVGFAAGGVTHAHVVLHQAAHPGPMAVARHAARDHRGAVCPAHQMAAQHLAHAGALHDGVEGRAGTRGDGHCRHGHDAEASAAGWVAAAA